MEQGKKIAIITGASRGVGKAIAERLAEEGYQLLINCRSNFQLLDTVAEALSEKTVCTAVHGEITKEILQEYLQKDFRTTLSAAAAPELVLVNNGGISTFHLAQDVPEEELTDMMESNLLSMFRLTRGVIPYLLKAKQGRILNISSVWGLCGASMESVYSMTKGGVNAFTKALGKELAPNHIPVNALALGAVNTDMNRWMGEEDLLRLQEEIPYGRMAEPEEVADFAALILKSPAYLTGQILQFDGGWI